MPELCNLEATGRRGRLIGGAVALMLAGGLAVRMSVGMMSRLWLLALFGLVWLGALGVLQAWGHT